VLALAAVACTAGLGPPAFAQAVRRIGLDLTVSHASERPGPIDPAATELDRRLREDFRYGSLRVLQRRRLDLGAGEIGGLDLPTGKRVRIRPLHLGEGGALLAVDIDGTLHTDLRVRDEKPVVIGVDRFEDGRLILTLEPEY
jgi:hypothetical protein